MSWKEENQYSDVFLRNRELKMLGFGNAFKSVKMYAGPKSFP